MIRATAIAKQLKNIFVNLFGHRSHQTQETNNSSIPMSYPKLKKALRIVLETEPGSSLHAQELLKDLRLYYPVPLVEIVDRELWGLETDKLVTRTHAKSNIEDAKRNLGDVRKMILSEEEEQELLVVMSHWCGWSPTPAEHCYDSWVKFLQINYPQLENLGPVLDSLIWEDEIRQYSIGCPPPQPWLFLLTTRSSFYIYDFQNAAMMPAGTTIRDVIQTLRDRIWEYPESWVEEEPYTDKTPLDYFPVYTGLRDENGLYKLRQLLLEDL